VVNKIGKIQELTKPHFSGGSGTIYPLSRYRIQKSASAPTSDWTLVLH